MLDKIRILVVEDDRDLGRAWKRLLTSRGYEVRLARTLSAARQVLSTDTLTPLQLVLLDLELPDGDGATLLPTLEQQEHVPAVGIVSSHYDSVRAVELLGRTTAGIPKPVSDETLCAFVEALTGVDALASAVDAFGAKHGLSTSQKAVLRAAALGLNRAEASKALSVGHQTVVEQWKRIFDKTGLREQRRIIGELFALTVRIRERRP